MYQQCYFWKCIAEVLKVNLVESFVVESIFLNMFHLKEHKHIISLDWIFGASGFIVISLHFAIHKTSLKYHGVVHWCYLVSSLFFISFSVFLLFLCTVAKYNKKAFWFYWNSLVVLFTSIISELLASETSRSRGQFWFSVPFLSLGDRFIIVLLETSRCLCLMRILNLESFL